MILNLPKIRHIVFQYISQRVDQLNSKTISEVAFAHYDKLFVEFVREQ